MRIDANDMYRLNVKVEANVTCVRTCFPNALVTQDGEEVTVTCDTA